VVSIGKLNVRFRKRPPYCTPPQKEKKSGVTQNAKGKSGGPLGEVRGPKGQPPRSRYRERTKGREKVKEERRGQGRWEKTTVALIAFIPGPPIAEMYWKEKGEIRTGKKRGIYGWKKGEQKGRFGIASKTAWDQNAA